MHLRLSSRGFHLTRPILITPIIQSIGHASMSRERRSSKWNAQLWLGCCYENNPMTAIMLNVRGSNSDETNLRRLDEQPFHLGTWSRSYKYSEDFSKRACRRLSYMNSIKASENASLAYVVLLKPTPTVDYIRFPGESAIRPRLFTSIKPSRGYSAPRIESIQSKLPWQPNGEPSLLTLPYDLSRYHIVRSFACGTGIAR